MPKPFNQTLFRQNWFDVEYAGNDDRVEFPELVDSHRVQFGAFGGLDRAARKADGPAQIAGASLPLHRGWRAMSMCDHTLVSLGSAKLGIGVTRSGRSICPTARFEFNARDGENGPIPLRFGFDFRQRSQAAPQS